MSAELKGKTCGVCHAYLFPEDDVVFCPVCGAPHHRECYNKIGHCALEEFHGTDRQYDVAMAKREKENIQENTENKNEGNFAKCPMCEEKYDNSLNSCPNCSTPNFRMNDGYRVYDFLGGVPADMDVGGGVTADEAKRFVFSNTGRYIPKFAAANAGKKTSWNWFAFLFPCSWFLSRKMYLYGVLAGILTVLSALFSYPLQDAIYSLGIDLNNTRTLVSEMMGAMPEIGTSALILSALGGFINLLFRFLAGIFGDFIYSRHAINAIKDIKENSEDRDADFAKRGGVNVLLAAVGFFATDIVYSIIITFL
ncbi:MAG: DUF2628 domain-containing protein [Clostridia bacterium]|nr:DUF2628 domain-containing protein [Clostridia bacterium]